MNVLSFGLTEFREESGLLFAVVCDWWCVVGVELVSICCGVLCALVPVLSCLLILGGGGLGMFGLGVQYVQWFSVSFSVFFRFFSVIVYYVGGTAVDYSVYRVRWRLFSLCGGRVGLWLLEGCVGRGDVCLCVCGLG